MCLLSKIFLFQSLVESASKILEPRYTAMWDRIATFTGTGPEHLLLMFERYGKTLIQNQEDTFTEPFEVASKNMSNYLLSILDYVCLK